MNEEDTKLAFVLNVGFSIFGLIGGFLTGSIAIFSSAIHDFSDSLVIVFSKIFEQKEQELKNKKYNILSTFTSATILITSSIIALFASIYRLFVPTNINGIGMILFSLFGILINGYATYKTMGNINENVRKFNVPMLVDVLGWTLVFIVAILIKTTNVSVLDPVLAILISIIISWKAVHNVTKTVDSCIDKVPENINLKKLEEDILKINHVLNIHFLHITKVEEKLFLNMHVVVEKTANKKTIETIKNTIKEKLKALEIEYSTIEMEYESCMLEEAN